MNVFWHPTLGIRTSVLTDLFFGERFTKHMKPTKKHLKPLKQNLDYIEANCKLCIAGIARTFDDREFLNGLESFYPLCLSKDYSHNAGTEFI